MEVIIRPTAADAVKLTARLIADAICEKPDFKLAVCPRRIPTPTATT